MGLEGLEEGRGFREGFRGGSEERRGSGKG